MAAAADLKSAGHCVRVGSSPIPATKFIILCQGLIRNIYYVFGPIRIHLDGTTKLSEE